MASRAKMFSAGLVECSHKSSFIIGTISCLLRSLESVRLDFDRLVKFDLRIKYTSSKPHPDVFFLKNRQSGIPGRTGHPHSLTVLLQLTQVVGSECKLLQRHTGLDCRDRVALLPLKM